ncbi:MULTISPECIES: 16S rRNA (guanine(966)-N(2))-methyltransferase RsmD [Commensalibacter]|uniref:Methyltransferase n=2 Tax=Commensalibacter TaxID=1079922 RepID=W7E469_9PROT|nr:MULTISPECIES: 16S rRNA (guanine(966)-N(2))-methyltransferase RsmD [Commensalibacter]EUK17856.1 methyltransferase [Commensalibacter papalotli (ex Servin-Garciduenas et al. 2014)]CAI3942889.1 16S rRNA G966 N2-methylase RsmD (RsmD) (PDB:2IFT) [Commensalibacter papalotli (ex Botero et al. 2024)]CAI3948043.1 16S rRNA G966 N2-methylase RsmD (RsmD) (PDB:2IFT) [Commensalibacter papalotli (ex Botero et al. 2024)]
MRIIAGNYKGTTLFTPIGKETRPTSDRARQTLFDILMHAPWAGKKFMENAIILDAFAGTGALGLEAISRGAQKAYFFEKNVQTRQTLEKNIQLCRANSVSILYKDVLTPPLSPCSCNLLFLDPPYHQELIPIALKKLQQQKWILPDALIITETAINEELPINQSFDMINERKIGAAYLKFWKQNNIIE